MKVLFICLGIYSTTGGMQRFNQRVVKALSELRNDVVKEVVVVSLWDSQMESHMVPPYSNLFSVNSSKIKFTFIFLWKLLKYRPNKILYGHILLTPLAILAFVLRPNAKQFLFVHGIEVWGDKNYRRPSLIELFVTRKMIHKIISVSRFTANKMMELFRIEEKRFLMFLNALDIESHPKEDIQANIKRIPRLLTVSRLNEHDWEKGCHRVIQALPLILKTWPNLQYYVVGKGILKEKLENLACAFQVSGHVNFLGYLDDSALVEMYSSADIFIMPSTKEGFGIVYLEAWKYRLPVIAGNRDASSEVVTSELNGYLVDPDSTEAIARAVESLLRFPQEAKKLGEMGYQTLVRKYSHRQFRERLRDILLEVNE